MGLGAGLLGVDGVVVAFRKPNADPPLDGPTLEASVGAVGAAAATGSAAAAGVLFTVMFPNKLLDPDDGATGAGSAETEKLPSKSPLLSVDSVDTNAGAAGELAEGTVLFTVIPPNMESPPPNDTFATDCTTGGAGGAATGAAGTSDGPSKSNKLGASAAAAATTGRAAAAVAPPLLLIGEAAVAVPGATPSNPNTLFAGALTDCRA
mmetsp:Transcript_29328/g.59063  ORF Transcript_29328/g.59063 Transcript_29328/m.59063 type:complete len:207 (-) Transcript_29328:1138-1758(-)